MGLEFFDATTFQAKPLCFTRQFLSTANIFCEQYNEELSDADPEVLLSSYMDYNNIEEWLRPHWIEGKKREALEKGNLKSRDSTKNKLSNC